MATTVDTLLVRIEAETKGFRADLDQFQKRVDQIAQRTENSFGRIGTFAKAAIGGVVAFQLAQAGRQAIGFVSHVEEMQAKSSVVFGRFAGDVRRELGEFAKEVGRSRFELEEMAASVQDTFVPLGFARGEAAKLSVQMAKLATDVASFNNASDTETMASFQSALIGNHETVRRFGIVITENTLQQELYRMGIQKTTQQASNQEKVHARLNIILAGTTDAQGDALRTANSFANRMKSLGATVQEATLTAFQPMIQSLADLVGIIQNTIQRMQPFLSLVGRGMASAFDSLGDAIEFVVRNIRTLTLAMGAFVATQVALVAVNAARGFVVMAKSIREAAKAGQLFNKVSKGTLLSLLLAGSVAAADQMGLLDDALDSLADKFPALASIAGGTTEELSDLDAEAQALLESFEAVSGSAVGLDESLALVGKRTKAASDQLGELRTVMAGFDADRAKAMAKAGIRTQEDGTLSGVPSSSEVDKAKEAITALETRAEELAKTGKKLSEEEATLLMDAQKVLDADAAYQKLMGTLREVEIAEEKVDKIKLAEKTLEEKTAAEKLQEKLDALNSVVGRAGVDQKALAEAIGEVQTEMALLDPSVQAMVSSFDKAGDQIADAMITAFKDTENAMEQFKDIGDMIVNEIIRSFLRLQVINPMLNSIFNLKGKNAFAEGDILGGLGNLFGGGDGGGGGGESSGLGALVKGGLSFIGGLFGGKAGGGSISGPTIVGERGPELFIPHSAGKIKNNMDTLNQGGDTVVINQSLNLSTGVAETVRSEVLAMMPTIQKQTVGAVREAKLRGGSFASAFRG